MKYRLFWIKLRWIDVERALMLSPETYSRSGNEIDGSDGFDVSDGSDESDEFDEFDKGGEGGRGYEICWVQDQDQGLEVKTC